MAKVFFEVDDVVHRRATELAVSQKTTIALLMRKLLTDWAIETSGRADIAPVPRISATGKIILEKVPEVFTTRQAADALGTSTANAKFALDTLIGKGLIEKCGSVPTGSRWATAFRRTTSGKLHTAIQVERADAMTKVAERDSAKLFLMSKGKTHAEAEQMIQDEELLKHMMGDEYKPDYSLAFWEQCLLDLSGPTAGELSDAQAAEKAASVNQ